MPTLGFIGTGTISAAMVRGLKASPLADWPVLLSPRNAEVASALAASLPGVTVASDNQAVIDGAEMVILAVRPQVAEAVLRPLAIAADQTVVSLIAGLPIEAIQSWTGAGRVCRAVPLPFVEQCRDVTPVFPPDPEALALFNGLGRALSVADLATFEIYSAGSALMGTYFGILETAEAWAIAQGLPPADARAYFSGLFSNLGEVLRHSPSPLHELRTAHSTRGGMNEQVFARFSQAGGGVALDDALSSVLARIRTANLENALILRRVGRTSPPKRSGAVLHSVQGIMGLQTRLAVGLRRSGRLDSAGAPSTHFKFHLRLKTGTQTMSEAPVLPVNERKRGSGVKFVYDVLRDEILDLVLAPGSPIDEIQLAERLSMSRTPIREALVRLASEGLVTTLPNRSTVVANIDFLNLQAFFDALTLMYRVTTRLAAQYRTDDNLEMIRAQQANFTQAVQKHDALEMIALNAEFHKAIAAAARNPYFTGLSNRLLDEGRRLMRVYYSSFGDHLPHRYVVEHEDIIAAIVARDLAMADTLASAHADQIVSHIKASISRDDRLRIAL